MTPGDCEFANGTCPDIFCLYAGRVGKTSLVLKYCHGVFVPKQGATEQAAYNNKQLLLGEREVLPVLCC